MQYRVLYRPGPSWEVGEGTEDHTPGTRYPDDYAGRVVAVLPAGDKRDGAGASAVTIELTAGQRDSLASRKMKISAGEAVDTTFDDRWGAAADMIRAEFLDAEESEREAILREESPDLAPVLAEPTSLVKVPVRGFEEISGLAVRSLPKNLAHSGTGYYASKDSLDVTQLDRTQSGAPSGQVISLTSGGLGVSDAFKGGYVTNVTRTETLSIVSHVDDAVTLEGSLTNWVDTDDLDIFDAWATAQGPCDQLWLDQGAAMFTDTQKVRLYAATYTETVAPNVGLVPDRVNGHLLIIEGDPDDDRENIIINGGGGGSFWAGPDHVILRHAHWYTSGTSTAPIRFYSGCYLGEVHDCKVTAATSASGITSYYSIQVKDCEITIGGTANWGIVGRFDHVDVARTTISGPGKATSTGGGILTGQTPSQIIGCVVSGFAYGLLQKAGYAHDQRMRVANCTFYDCTYALGFNYVATGGHEISNNIFKDCTYNYYMIGGVAWPEETTTTRGDNFVQRNNCYHGYTNFAYDGTDTKTFAEWTAFGNVDAANELDAVDPGLTDPGAGDFSLEEGSTSQHTGSGSGVPYDVDGVPFDPYHPDRGAKSTGIGPNVAFAGK